MQPTFIIYRILGNSLPPRHGPEDTYINLRFILENEPPLPGCEKRWLLNRFTDPKAESQLAKLIEEYGQEYHVIPFDAAGYKRTFLDASGMPKELNPFFNQNFRIPPLPLEWIHRHKSLALIDLNDARNQAIELGKAGATWILPLDGSCYFTTEVWERFVQGISIDPDSLYAIISLVRLNSNDDLKNPAQIAITKEEPQIAFRQDAPDRYDERLRYGHRNKGELLARLGVPGPWMNWQAAAWDHPDPLLPIEPNRFTLSGTVYRLASNVKNEANRYAARFYGIQQITQQLDTLFLQESYAGTKGDEYCVLNKGGDCHPVAGLAQLKDKAERLLSATIRRITDKSELPPSGNKQDYFSRPRQQPGANGKPVSMNGQSSVFPAIESGQNPDTDQAALCECIQHTALLTAAGVLCNQNAYLQRAAKILDVWFVDQATCMNPHALFAQFVPVPDAPLNYVGLIEFRDLWMLPCLSKTLLANNALTGTQHDAIKLWAAKLLDYLNGSEQGQRAFGARNNIGTWMHLLKTSLSLFTNRFDDASFLLRTASLRLAMQCDVNGAQSEELACTLPLHHSLFNITAWALLADLGRSVEVDIWSYGGLEGQSIENMIRFAKANMTSFKEYENDPKKYQCWLESLLRLTPESALSHAESPKAAMAPDQACVDDPDTGLPPQWDVFLCRKSLPGRVL